MDLTDEDHLARCEPIDQLLEGDFPPRIIEECIGAQLVCSTFGFRSLLRRLGRLGRELLGGKARSGLFHPGSILVRAPGCRSG